MIPFEIMIAKTFGMIPALKWGNYFPDPNLSIFNHHLWVDFASTLP
jgi:hypothetical protein